MYNNTGSRSARGRPGLLDPQLTSPGDQNEGHWNDHPLGPWLFGALIAGLWLLMGRRQVVERNSYDE